MRRAVLFGLNYQHCSSGRLEGCINDVRDFSGLLEGRGFSVEVHTDDRDRRGTSKVGILGTIRSEVRALTSGSVLWIHYSGHGTYVKDHDLVKRKLRRRRRKRPKRKRRKRKRKEERDGRDECLVPSDYETNGLIKDDDIRLVLEEAPRGSRIICIFDSCHSGTVGDMKYSWPRGRRRPVVENVLCDAQAKVLTISGCLDRQTSADAYSVFREDEYGGAMSSALHLLIRDRPKLMLNCFDLVRMLQQKLRRDGFTQQPLLASSYNLARYPAVLNNW